VLTDEELIKKLAGSLNFILAFYVPGQRHLDTEAWKQACASGVDAFNAANERIGSLYPTKVASNGTVQEVRK
jgi:hypothetical protein